MSAKLNKRKAKAVARSIRMSPYKTRRILDQIRGCTYVEAIYLLSYMPYRACGPILKVLYSAASNAKNKFGVPITKVIISEATADQGPIMKRFQPRAQGRAFPIHKPTCHISITVEAVKVNQN